MKNDKTYKESVKAAKIVRSWPEWKRNLLLNSLNPRRIPVK